MEMRSRDVVVRGKVDRIVQIITTAHTQYRRTLQLVVGIIEKHSLSGIKRGCRRGDSVCNGD